MSTEKNPIVVLTDINGNEKRHQFLNGKRFSIFNSSYVNWLSEIEYDKKYYSAHVALNNEVYELHIHLNDISELDIFDDVLYLNSSNEEEKLVVTPLKSKHVNDEFGSDLILTTYRAMIMFGLSLANMLVSLKMDEVLLFGGFTRDLDKWEASRNTTEWMPREIDLFYFSVLPESLVESLNEKFSLVTEFDLDKYVTKYLSMLSLSYKPKDDSLTHEEHNRILPALMIFANISDKHKLPPYPIKYVKNMEEFEKVRQYFNFGFIDSNQCNGLISDVKNNLINTPLMAITNQSFFDDLPIDNNVKSDTNFKISLSKWIVYVTIEKGSDGAINTNKILDDSLRWIHQRVENVNEKYKYGLRYNDTSYLSPLIVPLFDAKSNDVEVIIDFFIFSPYDERTQKPLFVGEVEVVRNMVKTYFADVSRFEDEIQPESHPLTLN